MVKILVHISDVHIRTYKHHQEYKSVFETLLNDLKVKLKDYKREEIRIVLTGDIVHQKIIISNEQLVLVSWLLSELEKIARVILIAGNHDMLENNKDRLDSLSPIVELLGDKDIKYFKESKCYEDDNIVWCVYSIFESNERPDIENARDDYGTDKKYIGLFHGPVTNAKTDLGFVFDDLSGMSIKKFLGCDAVLMGDIHLKQDFLLDKTPIVYAGSLIQQNFGEKIKGHGYILWDVNDLSYEHVEIPNNYLYLQFKINSLNDLDNNKEILVNV